MMKKTPEDILAHYGILGMKWGVRRERGPDGRVSGGLTKRQRAKKEKKATAQLSEDHEKSRRAIKKGVRALSDAELKDLIKRLEMEKKYNDLNPQGIQKGHAVAKTFLAGATTITSIYAISKTPLAQDVAKAVGAVVQKKAG